MKVAIIQPHPHPANLRRAKLFSDFLSEQNRVDIVNLFDTGQGKPSLRAAVRAIGALVKNRYDVFHFMGITWTPPQLLRLLTRHRGVIIYDAGNVEIGVARTLARSPVMIGIISGLETLFVGGADIVITRGVSFVDYFRTHYMHRLAPFYYVPDPVDFPALSRDSTAIDTHPLRVAYVSTFVMIDVAGERLPRGWELIDSIALQRRKNRVDVNVDFIGKGDGIEALRARAEEARVADLCTFSGFVPNEILWDRLRSATIGFMEDYDTLGYRYSVGSKVQEYMAVGLPVLTGRSPEKLHLLADQQLPEVLFDPPVLEEPEQIQAYIRAVAGALKYADQSRSALRQAGRRNGIRAKLLFDKPVLRTLLNQVYLEAGRIKAHSQS